MSKDLNAYVYEYIGWAIDVDNAYGAQCWDQWSHYATNFLGVPSWPTYTNAGGTWPHGGYACNVYHNAAAAGLLAWFDVLPADADPRPGDVAFWEYGSAWYPWSHVATVLGMVRPGMLRCLTQNPGAVQVADLIMRGIIGYLRPKETIYYNGIPNRTPAIPASVKREAARNRKKDEEMLFFYCYDNKRYYNVTLGVKGSFWSYETNQINADRMASQRGPAFHVSQKTYNTHEEKWG